MKSLLKINTSFVSPLTFKTFTDSNILPIFIIRNIRNSELIGKYEGSAIHFRNLAPSTELFRMKRDNKITLSEFKEKYKNELAKQDLVNVIYKFDFLANLCHTDKLVLLGYGTDRDICHRSVLAEVLNESGLLEYPIKEFCVV